MKLWKVVGGAVLVAAAGAAIAEPVQSLRGEAGVESSSGEPELYRYQRDRETIARDYVQQPPLIPHSIKGYRVNLRSNKCLTCHSWANYQQAGATKVSLTHFQDRDGNELATVSPRRYFCTQCHVPQIDAPPLVENDFQPLRAIQP